MSQEAKALAAGRAGTRDVFEQKPTSQFDERNREPAPAKYVQALSPLRLTIKVFSRAAEIND